MARRRSILSDATKVQLAAIQGVAHKIQPPGYYGELTSKETGNFVKYAIALAEQSLAGVQAPLPPKHEGRPS